MSPKPVLLFAFANDPQEFLPELKNERQSIEGIFQGNEDLEIKVLPDASRKDIADVFLNEYFHGRIIGFHYGGHADEGALMLKDARGHENDKLPGKSLAAFLGEQPGLQFVFLNGCATGPQVDALFDAGIPNVIATERKINDGAAAALSQTFYRQLKKEGVSISKAFRMAQVTVEMQFDRNANDAISWTRGFKWEEKESSEAGFPWNHYFKGEAPPETPLIEPNPEPEAEVEPELLGLDQIRAKVSDGEFGEALEALKAYTKDHSSSDKNMVIMLSAQAKDYEREYQRGTLRDPERRKASLTYRFLDFLNTLE